MMAPLLANGMNVTWWLLPLVVTVSLVYNASRYELPERILRRSLKMGVAIMVFMVGSLSFLYVLS